MEIWKDIEGYEGLYQISNLSRIKSLWFGKEKILKLFKLTTHYKGINLYKNGIMDTYLVHRLVGIHFIPNPLNHPFVCHRVETLDENGLLYNGVENLFWGTSKDNMQDMWKKGRGISSFTKNSPKFHLGKFGTDNHLSKKVYQYDLEGNLVKEWGSLIDAKKVLGINNISACCRGKQKTAGGFSWSFTIK